MKVPLLIEYLHCPWFGPVALLELLTEYVNDDNDSAPVVIMVKE